MLGAWLNDPASWEVDWTRAVGGWPRWLGWPLELVMQVGTRWAYLTAALVVLLAGRVKHAITIVTACTVAWLASRWLKDVVDRPRPTAADFGRPLREIPEGLALPSGHATIVTALVVALIGGTGLRRSDGTTWIVAIVAGALVVIGTGLGRMYVGAHWPIDVVAGMLVGALVGLAALWLVDQLATRIVRRDRPDRADPF